MSRLPITAVKQLATEHDLSQVIVFGWDGEQTHVATYGKSVEDCDQAARGANAIKHKWKWPEETMAEPSRVKALRAEIKQLKEQLAQLTGTSFTGFK
jgi:transposase-like protein